MRENIDCFKYTFFTLVVLVVISIFIGIQLEERLYDYEEQFDFVDDQVTEYTSASVVKKEIPILTNMKLPHHNQEDPELVKDLFAKILPPCPHLTEYKLFKNRKIGRIGKFDSIRKTSNSGGNRFFLECGAADGESLTNTLYLEKNNYWQGLLVEADPVHFDDLIKVHRKAHIAPVCMSPNTSTFIADFKSSRTFEGRLLKANESLEGDDVVKVICYPFYTFILALNLKRIDYLSLSVQGLEMEILETIPFHKVDIGFISVDFAKIRGGYEGLNKFMKEHGYELLKEFPPRELLFVNIDEDYW